MTALLLALAPVLAMRFISDQELSRSRDLWLLAVLAVAAALLWPTAPWLSCIAVWFLWSWRSMDLLPSLVTWIGIGASWYAFRALAPWAWTYLPAVWLLIGVWHVAILIRQYDRTRIVGLTGAIEVPQPAWLLRLTAGASRWRTARPWGLLGSAPTTALYLALVTPFAPWWLLPVFLGGLWLTGSYVAMSATLVGLCVVLPSPAREVSGGLATLSAAMVILMLWRERDGRIHVWAPWLDRYTTHRASLDGLRLRLNAIRVVWLLWRREPWRTRLEGHGPGSLEPELKRRSFAWEVALPEGGPFCEPLWMAYDMGICGLLAMLLFAVQVGHGLQLGDAWSGALVTGAVLSLGHFPMRLPQTGLVWLAISARLSVQ